MSKPSYTPLVNKHLRFYFSNPDRDSFSSSVDEKQFNAVKSVLQAYSTGDKSLIRAIISPTSPDRRGDKCIASNIERITERTGVSQNELHTLLARVSKDIAIYLEYIPEDRR